MRGMDSDGVVLAPGRGEGGFGEQGPCLAVGGGGEADGAADACLGGEPFGGELAGVAGVEDAGDAEAGLGEGCAQGILSEEVQVAGDIDKEPGGAVEAGCRSGVVGDFNDDRAIGSEELPDVGEGGLRVCKALEEGRFWVSRVRLGADRWI